MPSRTRKQPTAADNYLRRPPVISAATVDLVRRFAREADGPFSRAEAARALGRTRPNMVHAFRHLEANGIIERTGTKRGNAELFAYVPIPAHVAPKQADSRPSTPGSDPVAGTGAVRGPSDPATRALLRELSSAPGVEVERGSKHYVVRLNGRVVGTVTGTPSDHRAVKNARANLRRNGVRV